MTTVMPNLCNSCKHLKEFKGKGTCPAFPSGIPEDIRIFGGDHRQVVEGQKGTTVHNLLPGKEEDYEDWVFTYVLPPPVE